jgi:hypothetical protein
MWFCFSSGEGCVAVGYGSGAAVEVAEADAVEPDATDDVLDTDEILKTDASAVNTWFVRVGLVAR